MADVFLSYNREDQPRARTVADALEAEGFSIWWDAALRAGETYDEVTEQNLRQAAAVVVLWSKRSVNSKWVRAEATVGERSSTLVPALLEECDRPVRFELVQTADLSRWRGDRGDPQWRGFVADIRTAVARRHTVAPAVSATGATQSAAIETAFWNSIKDSRDLSDFEAYLARYPNGHFAALAQNRVNSAARPAVAPPQQQPRPQVAATAPARAPAQPARVSAPTVEPKKSVTGAIVVAALLCLIGIGGGAMMFLGKGDVTAEDKKSAEQEIAVPTSTPPPVVAEAPAPTAIEAETVAAVEQPAAEAIVEAEPETPVAPAATEPAPFRDCDLCPLMLPIKGGAYLMGSPGEEPGRNPYEGPQHEVTIPAFLIAAHEVTIAQWKICVEDGACASKRDGADDFPVLAVSWREAGAYVAWLSRKTKRAYRLPSEAEWEYAARGGATTAYWWGERFDAAHAPSSLAPVGASGANAFGLFDVAGNAREWTQDCYVNNFNATPRDGSAASTGDCSRRVIRGGAWSSAAADKRVANRSRIEVDGRPGYMGFRVAADAL